MAAQTWFKGNLHTHSTNSDGDTPPEHVAEWYLENGYDWLCLTDHNHLTDPGRHRRQRLEVADAGARRGGDFAARV